MKKKTNQTGRTRERGEHYTKMIRQTMEESAWRALSTTAQAIYPWFKLEWRGPDANNNGRISLSARQAAEKVGVRTDTAAEGIRDLQRKGFLVQTQPASLGIEGAARAAQYELTELKMATADGDGRKLYRKWEPGQDFEVPVGPANNPAGLNGRKTKPCHENHVVPNTKTVTNRASPTWKS